MKVNFCFSIRRKDADLNKLKYINFDLKIPVQISSFVLNTNIYYQNVGGLRSKLSEFFIDVSREEYSFITLTETCCRAIYQMLNCLIEIYRKDRYADSINRRGGVLIAI